MSKWISGKQIIKDKIQPIDLFEEYVRKGLQPYSQAGRPITPYELLEDIYDEMLAGADQGKSPLTIEGNETDGGDKVVYVRNSINLEIHIKQKLKRIEDISWQDFQLPEVDSEATALLNQLCQCIYKKHEVSGKPESKPAKKPRPEQLAREKCRAVAKKIWAHDKPPYIRSSDMSKRQELVEASEGAWKSGTVRRWISDLAPDRKPGLRKKKTKK
jgi:hypothetical protein